MVRQHQTSDTQLRIGESRDSGFDASHRPGMTSWQYQNPLQHPPEPHRLGDEAAQGRNALFDRWPGDEMVGCPLVQPALELIPELIVRPLLDAVVERTLHVITAAVHRAHGAERKAPRMIGIDQFVADRRRLRENPEPAERVDPLEGLDRRWLDA